MPLRLNRNTNFIKAIKATQTKLFSSYCIQTSCYLHAGTFNKKTRKILEDILEDMCFSFILGRCGYFWSWCSKSSSSVYFMTKQIEDSVIILRPKFCDTCKMQLGSWCNSIVTRGSSPKVTTQSECSRFQVKITCYIYISADHFQHVIDSSLQFKDPKLKLK